MNKNVLFLSNFEPLHENINKSRSPYPISWLEFSVVSNCENKFTILFSVYDNGAMSNFSWDFMYNYVDPKEQVSEGDSYLSVNCHCQIPLVQISTH